MGQNLTWLAGVGLEHGGEAVGPQRRAVRHGDRVDVHVDDARGRVPALGDLVHVADGGDAGAEVEELADAGVDRSRTARRRKARFGAHDASGMAAWPVRRPPGRPRSCGSRRGSSRTCATLARSSGPWGGVVITHVLLYADQTGRGTRAPHRARRLHTHPYRLVSHAIAP